MPGMEVMTPYSSGEYDVVTLGNSFTMARQVMDWKSYSSVAETMVNEDGISVDIHNLGIPGLTIPSYIARAPYILERYAPDIVVIQASMIEFRDPAFLTNMRGGHFELDVVNGLKVVLPSDPDDFLPEQMDPMVKPNIWEFSSLYAYWLSTKQQEVQDADPKTEVGERAVRRIVSQELQLLADAYGDVPIVLIIIPRGIDTKTAPPRYEETDQEKLILEIVADHHPNWMVIYPVKQFNQSIIEGNAPMGV